MSEPEPTDGEHDDPDELLDELERDAHEMEERSEKVAQEIDETRKDWAAKRRDPSEPGALPPHGDDDADTGPAPDQT